MERKRKTCRAEGCNNTFMPYRTTDKYCSYSCANKSTKKLLKITPKRAKVEREYSKLRKEFLSRPENKYCPITGEPCTDIHHKMGRVGYADEWARNNHVPLISDTRFWVALSRSGHEYVEQHPIWAKNHGYSIDRTNK